MPAKNAATETMADDILRLHRFVLSHWDMLGSDRAERLRIAESARDATLEAASRLADADAELCRLLTEWADSTYDVMTTPNTIGGHGTQQQHERLGQNGAALFAYLDVMMLGSVH